MTSGNFEALWPTDPKFSVFKDLSPFQSVSKVQGAGSTLRMGFALSKWLHLLPKMGFVDSLMHTTVVTTWLIENWNLIFKQKQKLLFNHINERGIEFFFKISYRTMLGNSLYFNLLHANSLCAVG